MIPVFPVYLLSSLFLLYILLISFPIKCKWWAADCLALPLLFFIGGLSFFFRFSNDPHNPMWTTSRWSELFWGLCLFILGFNTKFYYQLNLFAILDGILSFPPLLPLMFHFVVLSKRVSKGGKSRVFEPEDPVCPLSELASWFDDSSPAGHSRGSPRSHQ